MKSLRPSPYPYFFFTIGGTPLPHQIKRHETMSEAVRVRQFFLAFASVTLVAAACFPLTEVLGYRSVALLLLLTVSVLAMRLSLWPVLMAALLSALTWNFFFIPPIFTFHVDSTEDALLLVMFFIVALLNGVIQYRVRQLEQFERQKEEHETALRLYNTLFNSLSHELRTPIATIVGAADALRENAARLSEEHKTELLAEISAASLRLSQQVENLLSTSRLESGLIRARPDWCDVNELVYKVLEKLRTELADRKVEVSVPENLLLVQLDFGLMEQVLFNLLSNATHYTPPDATVFVSARISSDRRGHFSENPDETGVAAVADSVSHTLILEVADNGPGFPPDEMPHVFDKFYRLKNTRTGGTGLGLFIAKGFVEAQGGSISLANRAGGGAKFIIEMPTKTLAQ